MQILSYWYYFVCREGRAYKKTNWSVKECLVLQVAKREENDRHDKHKGAKEKWLAIEDYCWEHDVHRSGQQCKDRWYRMALEFKKVLEYQRATSIGRSSYWQLSGGDRKDARLPIVFHQEIYDAMVDWYLNGKPGNVVIDTSVPSPADQRTRLTLFPCTLSLLFMNAGIRQSIRIASTFLNQHS